MTTANANEVVLGIESFGDDNAPLVLLAGGTTMLSWPDALRERLAGGGRRVVRYDLRDSGESTTADPDAPAYTLRDLATDAAALADALGGRPAHLAFVNLFTGPATGNAVTKVLRAGRAEVPRPRRHGPHRPQGEFFGAGQDLPLFSRAAVGTAQRPGRVRAAPGGASAPLSAELGELVAPALKVVD